LPVDADLDIIKSVYEECRRLSVETGVAHEVDHIIPIAKGGSHHQDNLQILTMSENRKKGSNIL
jgi:5-methylcytosine-specific restriction endonuclease McrA